MVAAVLILFYAIVEKLGLLNSFGIKNFILEWVLDPGTGSAFQGDCLTSGIIQENFKNELNRTKYNRTSMDNSLIAIS